MVYFLLLFFCVWALWHGYLFWCLSELSFFRGRGRKWGLGLGLALLFAGYPLSRMAHGRGWDKTGDMLETVGANWIGAVLLLVTCLVIADLVGLMSLLVFKRLGRYRRYGLGAAGLLVVVALIQGYREPSMERVELALPNLPKNLDGMRVALMTDLHLGTEYKGEWFARQMARLDAEKPEMILFSGDVIDGDAKRVRAMIPDLAKAKAPLGVWAVLGNHDVYAQAAACEQVLTEAGVSVLRDRSVKLANGVRLVGVDDLPSSRKPAGPLGQIEEAFKDVKAGEPCIYLSHTPVEAEAAAAKGAGLMLCGHTHGGQIWPFGEIVRLRFPLFVGLYEAGPMKVFVSRGAGGWGPRMRLWKRGELVLITLRAP